MTEFVVEKHSLTRIESEEHVEEISSQSASTARTSAPIDIAVPNMTPRLRRRRTGLVVGIATGLVIAGGILGYRAFLNRAPSGAPITSIAVLPFKNESGNQDMDYLSDGISEGLINSLAQLPQLRVIARPTTFRYKGRDFDPKAVGRELSVAAVLTGTVRQSGDKLHVQVDLIDAATGAQLWGKAYERAFPEVLAVKQAIAREVAENLRLRLSGGEQQQLVKRDTANSDSYQSYLKGRYFWNKRTEDDLKKAIEYFNQATAQDPNYGAAYAGLADCYQVLPTYSNLPPEETYVKARRAANKALEIDETLAEAHASLGVIKFEYEWDFAGAEREYKRAIELNWNYAPAHQWYAEFLGNMGRYDQAIAEAKRALELDPLSLIINVVLGGVYSDARQYDQAEAQLRKTIELDRSFGQAHVILANNYIRKGMYLESIEEFRIGRILQGTDPETAARTAAARRAAYEKVGPRGYWQERLDFALKRFKQGRGSAYESARCYSRLGETDRAFVSLDKAYERREGMLSHLKSEVDYDNIRSDPRFPALLHRVGFQ